MTIIKPTFTQHPQEKTNTALLTEKLLQILDGSVDAETPASTSS